jgi:hypothetical protein
MNQLLVKNFASSKNDKDVDVPFYVDYKSSVMEFKKATKYALDIPENTETRIKKIDGSVLIDESKSFHDYGFQGTTSIILEEGLLPNDEEIYLRYMITSQAVNVSKFTGMV